MRRLAVLCAVVAAVLLVVPGWSGPARLALLGEDGLTTPRMTLRPVALDPRDPRRRRLGALRYLNGWQLGSSDAAFGGFSALTVRGRRVTMLSDGGNLVSFTLDRGRASAVSFADLPAGPGTGWDKADRDSESLVDDPVTGRHWVGFENYQAVMRFSPDFGRGDGWVRPAAMRRWPKGGGPEAMARLPDGRFVAISEQGHVPRALWRGSEKARWRTRDALIWPGDPVAGGAPRHFGYLIEGRFDVADAAALPDGRLLVLERAFDLPFRFHNRVMVVAAGAVRPGALVRGRLVATLDAPMIHDNFEGVAVTREGAATIVWLVSDDNGTPLLQRTLLLRFRLAS